MEVLEVLPGLYQLPLGVANAFVLDQQGLTLIDTGLPGSLDQIEAGLAQLGKRAADLDAILITHEHADHFGALGALQTESAATTYAARQAAPVVRGERPIPGMVLSPGLEELFRQYVHVPEHVDTGRVDRELEDGDRLPVAGGLSVIGAPGHAPGQVALLWPAHGGVLFAADAASNTVGLGLSLGYADLELGLGLSSLARLAGLVFEVACFGHGSPISSGASKLFRDRWPASARA